MTVHVTGMTCRACETRVSKALTRLPGVVDARASSMSGVATLTVTEPPPPEAVAAAVEAAGYEVGTPPLLSHDRTVWLTALAAAAAVALVVVLAASLGLTDLAGSVGGPGDGSLLVVLLVGLTAGVSTCMALVGGVVLALASSREVADDASRLQVMRPHLAFQVGRIVGFFVLGSALGALGARLAVPTAVQAALMIAVAVVMLVLGLRLTGLSPRAAGWSPTLPAGLARRLGLAERAQRPYSDVRAAGLGALTFFLPVRLHAGGADLRARHREPAHRRRRDGRLRDRHGPGAARARRPARPGHRPAAPARARGRGRPAGRVRVRQRLGRAHPGRLDAVVGHQHAHGDLLQRHRRRRRADRDHGAGLAGLHPGRAPSCTPGSRSAG